MQMELLPTQIAHNSQLNEHPSIVRVEVKQKEKPQPDYHQELENELGQVIPKDKAYRVWLKRQRALGVAPKHRFEVYEDTLGCQQEIRWMAPYDNKWDEIE